MWRLMLLLLASGYACAGADKLTGSWDCDIRVDTKEYATAVNSELRLDMAAGTFEREGNIDFRFKEINVAPLSVDIYMRGTTNYRDGELIVYPTDVSTEVMSKEHADNKSLRQSMISNLLEDGNYQKVTVTDDTLVLHANDIQAEERCERVPPAASE